MKFTDYIVVVVSKPWLFYINKDDGEPVDCFLPSSFYSVVVRSVLPQRVAINCEQESESNGGCVNVSAEEFEKESQRGNAQLARRVAAPFRTETIGLCAEYSMTLQ
jgi:hypothetical protein